ncbi:hypothetical protein O181_055596 [Austropuccinia psidii MF-1]|uniref:Uncharacterized protein n=1 Tax=Austropuccinia psidii MF-1 TaxID=1389203 RepID=A0A9Q3E4R4_9BASI|nr:hypothetical protein [Austropuccinia psidii MF-1]
MITRRGSRYYIQSDGAGLRSTIDPSKGKRKDKIPSGKESTQGSTISQRKVPEMPIISEPGLELKEEIVRYTNGWNPLSSKPKIIKTKEYHAKKKEAIKEETTAASTSRPQVNQPPQKGKKKKNNNLRKPDSSGYRIQKLQRDSMENVFNMARTLMEFKDKEEPRMRQLNFPKK